jgi:ABC-2 type transport system permease protein
MILASTVRRVLGQLRHDHRTVALLVVVPPLLLTLLYFMFDDSPLVFQGIARTMLGIFPFTIMFLITSIAMLRERTTGTLERLLTTPMGKLDLLFGYGTAFGLAATLQGEHRLRRRLSVPRSADRGQRRSRDHHRGRERRAGRGAGPAL